MIQAIRLNEFGVRLFVGRLYNHDYLWFSSNEISKVSTTEPFLHNYALCYALAQRSHRTSTGSMPKYILDAENEFGTMPLYATPAQTSNARRTTITFNALDSLTLTTGDSKAMNTPNLGKRVYLNLQWEAYDMERPKLGYEFYVFTFNDYRLPGAFRLGKKGASMRARWSELPNCTAVFRDQPERPTHVINPLDANGNITRYEPISIPPHLLMRSVTLEQSWFIFSGSHAVNVPKRVLKKIGVSE